MYYLIDKEALYGRIDKEVSRVADDAYGDDGQSLYDSIVLTSRDRDMVDRYVNEAVGIFVRRAFDICKYAPLINYVQKKNGNGDPLYYEVDETGKPTTTETTSETSYPVYTNEIASITERLVFYVPDFDITMEDDALEQISRYITLYVANMIFMARRAAVVPMYTEQAQFAMDRAVTLLKSRKAPNESWS